jgi:hypothetical protein
VTFTAVSGATVEALVIYRKNSGANTTWRLVAYIDTSVTGLPVTPNGGDITLPGTPRGSSRYKMEALNGHRSSSNWWPFGRLFIAPLTGRTEWLFT